MENLTENDRQIIVRTLIREGEWGTVLNFATPGEFMVAVSHSGMSEEAAKNLWERLHVPEQKPVPAPAQVQTSPVAAPRPNARGKLHWTKDPKNAHKLLAAGKKSWATRMKNSKKK